MRQWRLLLPRKLDKVLFVKNGYSFFRHLVPFAVASLLLLVVAGQTSTDNLLFRVLRQLEKPTILWVPATVLTLVTFLIYFLTLKKEIKTAYLFHDRLCQRTVGTVFFFLMTCTGMAVWVLCHVSDSRVGFFVVWTGLLISILSMTGIEWKTPEIVSGVGIRVPNYENVDKFTSTIRKILTQCGERPHKISTAEDVKGVKRNLEGLVKLIDENLNLEPLWARDELAEVLSHLQSVVDILDHQFLIDEDAIRDLYVAWKYDKHNIYSDFIQHVAFLHTCWPEWKVN